MSITLTTDIGPVDVHLLVECIEVDEHRDPSRFKFELTEKGDQWVATGEWFHVPISGYIAKPEWARYRLAVTKAVNDWMATRAGKEALRRSRIEILQEELMEVQQVLRQQQDHADRLQATLDALRDAAVEDILKRK